MHKRGKGRHLLYVGMYICGFGFFSIAFTERVDKQINLNNNNNSYRCIYFPPPHHHHHHHLFPFLLLLYPSYRRVGKAGPRKMIHNKIQAGRFVGKNLGGVARAGKVGYKYMYHMYSTIIIYIG